MERSNLNYRAEIEHLRFQLDMKSAKVITGPTGPSGKQGTPVVTLTPLQNGQVKFEFPEMSEAEKTKARQSSLTEFTKFLGKL